MCRSSSCINFKFNSHITSVNPFSFQSFLPCSQIHADAAALEEAEKEEEQNMFNLYKADMW